MCIISHMPVMLNQVFADRKTSRKLLLFHLVNFGDSWQLVTTLHENLQSQMLDTLIIPELNTVVRGEASQATPQKMPFFNPFSTTPNYSKAD